METVVYNIVDGSKTVVPLTPEEIAEKQQLAQQGSIQNEINRLEQQQTPRRLREAALGDAEAIAFLQDLEDQIAALRAQIED